MCARAGDRGRGPRIEADADRARGRTGRRCNPQTVAILGNRPCVCGSPRAEGRRQRDRRVGNGNGYPLSYDSDFTLPLPNVPHDPAKVNLGSGERDRCGMIKSSDLTTSRPATRVDLSRILIRTNIVKIRRIPIRRGAIINRYRLRSRLRHEGGEAKREGGIGCSWIFIRGVSRRSDYLGRNQCQAGQRRRGVIIVDRSGAGRRAYRRIDRISQRHDHGLIWLVGVVAGDSHGKSIARHTSRKRQRAISDCSVVRARSRGPGARIRIAHRHLPTTRRAQRDDELKRRRVPIVALGHTRISNTQRRLVVIISNRPGAGEG